MKEMKDKDTGNENILSFGIMEKKLFANIRGSSEIKKLFQLHIPPLNAALKFFWNATEGVPEKSLLL